MGTRLRLIVGGLPPDLSTQQIKALLHPVDDVRLCQSSESGAGGEGIVIAQLGNDRPLASRLCQRLHRRTLNDHRLWAWISVLPWA